MKKMVLLIAIILSSSCFATYDYIITDGMVFGIITLRDSQSLLMTGGGGVILEACNFSVLDIRGTAPYNQDSYPFGGIGTFALVGHSRLSLSGGEIGRMDIDGFATAVISGGNIYTLRNYNSYPVYDKRIEIICRDYDYNSSTKKLTGTWDVDNNKDGLFDTFHIQLSDDPKYTYTPTYNILEFTIVPEPVTVLLLGLGGLLVRRK